jgi:hypothetical protein
LTELEFYAILDEQQIQTRVNFMAIPVDAATKEDLKNLREDIVHQFHIISEGLVGQIKLLAEGHTGIIERLDRVENRFDRMEKDNERQHLETRALIKLSFSELDRRLSSLESQVSELKEWRKKVEERLRV